MNFSNLKKILEATFVISSIWLMTNNPVAAQMNGSSYSRGSNVPDMSFDLIFQKSNGTTIQDSSIGNNSGLFVEAIQNFSYLGNLTPNPSGISPLYFEFTNANLRTTLLKNSVIYTIIATRSFELIDATAQPILLINPDQFIIDRPPTIINPNPVFTFSVDISSFSPENKLKAVNDLQYITENHLYASSSLESQRFVSSTFNGLTLGIATGDLDITEISDTPINELSLNNDLFARSSLFQGVEISEISNQAIPEPSVNIGLLTLVLFATTTILKRQLWQN